jgi:hypothetical protein
MDEPYGEPGRVRPATSNPGDRADYLLGRLFDLRAVIAGAQAMTPEGETMYRLLGVALDTVDDAVDGNNELEGKELRARAKRRAT